MHPVIGVSTLIREFPTPFGPLASHVVAQLYSTAIREAGGIPVLLSVTGNIVEIDAVLGRIDGLCLTGGGDVDPTLHGRSTVDAVYGVDRERDTFELALVRAAQRLRLPLLAVCRGAQVVNVALGGDLVVDIQDEITGAVPHRIAAEGQVAVHSVRVDAQSSIVRILGAEEITVSSSHHQSARRLGDGLRAVAWSPDGVVEAIEAESHEWPCWGVQWHPEFRTPDNAASRRLFDGLIAAAEVRADDDTSQDVLLKQPGPRDQA